MADQEFTPAQIVARIFQALSDGDMQVVSRWLRLLAVQDPVSAVDIYDGIRLGIEMRESGAVRTDG